MLRVVNCARKIGGRKFVTVDDVLLCVRKRFGSHALGRYIILRNSLLKRVLGEAFILSKSRQALAVRNLVRCGVAERVSKRSVKIVL